MKKYNLGDLYRMLSDPLADITTDPYSNATDTRDVLQACEDAAVILGLLDDWLTAKRELARTVRGYGRWYKVAGELIEAQDALVEACSKGGE